MENKKEQYTRSGEQKCEAGCKVFTGGEVRHVKECVFYPESFSEMYDEQKARIKELEAEKKILMGALEVAGKVLIKTQWLK